MKIGIISMVSDNYGNRLQNYALQEVLTEMGNLVETLNNPWNDDYNPGKELVKSNVKKFIYGLTRKPARYERKINFDKFNNTFIKFSKFWLNLENDRKKAAEYYDLFICGSDQVWNSEAWEITGKYFADFADKKKRASYAASFGIENIIEDRKGEFKDYLLGMNYISVREQSGVNIVENLIGKKVNCHLDPTLLLSASEWNNVVGKSLKVNDKYMLCYFLGSVSEDFLSEIARYSKEMNIKIFSICNEQNATHNNVGPDEFVSLIRNAEFILTDSFHGTVFSIIYHKPFYTFSRKGVKQSMDTRVTSLLKLLGFEERFEPNYKELNQIFNVDFNKADEVLKKEKKKAMEYLSLVTKSSS